MYNLRVRKIRSVQRHGMRGKRTGAANVRLTCGDI